MENRNDTLLPLCSSCAAQLCEPYIECAECPDTHLCTSCFSRGAAPGTHHSHHCYAVRKNNFPLFENCHWTARDEFQLLKAIGEHGYGNWEEISKSMQTHSKLECQEHYKKFYLNEIQNEDLSKVQFRNEQFLEPPLPFLLKESNIDDPFRQTKSSASQQLSGYNPYRSDFEINYDNNAENILNFQITDDIEDEDLMKSLQCSLVMAYNNKLRERQRRYSVIRRHGLILPRKTTSWLQRFEETLNRQTCEKLIVFMQLLEGIQFDTFFERILIEKELCLYLMRLHDFRKNGLTTFKGCYLYQNLKRKKENQFKELKNFIVSYDLDWKQLSQNGNDLSWKNPLNKPETMYWKNVINKDLKISQSRKITPPLEIIGLPGYEKLTEKERELCSTVRLVPVNFIEFRDLLISENNKNGCLRLLDARRLIKIDVNKTRKLYDFLVLEGFVKKPF